MQQETDGVSISPASAKEASQESPRVWDPKRKEYVRYVEKTRYITRLSTEVYQQFIKGLPGPQINPQADAATDAAFKLGIQYVLEKLRKELVIE